MTAADAYLRCKIDKGQFSDEVSISGRDSRGAEFSLFVDKAFLKDRDERSGLLVVQILQEVGEHVLVRLPGRTFENGSTITVGRSEIADCPAWQQV